MLSRVYNFAVFARAVFICSVAILTCGNFRFLSCLFQSSIKSEKFLSHKVTSSFLLKYCLLKSCLLILVRSHVNVLSVTISPFNVFSVNGFIDECKTYSMSRCHFSLCFFILSNSHTFSSSLSHD